MAVVNAMIRIRKSSAQVNGGWSIVAGSRPAKDCSTQDQAGVSMTSIEKSQIKLLTVKGTWELGTWILASYRSGNFENELDTQLATMLDPDLAAGGATAQVIKQWAATLAPLNLEQLVNADSVKSEMAFRMAAMTVMCPIIWSKRRAVPAPSEALPEHDANTEPHKWTTWPEAIVEPVLEQSARSKGEKDNQIRQLINILADAMAEDGDDAAHAHRIRSLIGRLYLS